MKRTLVQGRTARLLVLGFTSAFVAVAAPADEVATTARPGHGHGGGHSLPLPSTTACLESAVTAGRNNGTLSGISAAVVVDGRVVYHRGFGTVSPASTQAVLPSTRFRIASVTKMMTATALLSLAEEGRIRLHAPASALLPGLELPGPPEESRRLTAHRLLSHQGGIRDSAPLVGPTDDGALAAAFYDPAFLATAPLMVAPGTFYNYSNPNFMLAGLLAETAAGKPYRHLMRQRVFKPLRMTRSALLPSEVLADNDFAFGVAGPNALAPDAYDNAITRPAGFVWSSADDLAKFMLFLLRGDRDVLSHRMWRELQTRQVNTLQLLDIQGYGYGLVVEESVALPDSTGQPRFYEGVKTVWHDGATLGYQSFMATLPRQQFGFVALMNANPGTPAPNLAACFRSAAVETISARLPAPSPFPDPDIQRDRFADYVGHFKERTPIIGPAVVTLAQNGELNIRWPVLDLSNFVYDPVLVPASRDNFVMRFPGGSLFITGIREGASDVKYLRTRLTVVARASEEPSTSRLTDLPTIDPVAIEKALREAASERTTLLLP